MDDNNGKISRNCIEIITRRMTMLNELRIVVIESDHESIGFNDGRRLDERTHGFLQICNRINRAIRHRHEHRREGRADRRSRRRCGLPRVAVRAEADGGEAECEAMMPDEEFEALMARR